MVLAGLSPASASAASASTGDTVENAADRTVSAIGYHLEAPSTPAENHRSFTLTSGPVRSVPLTTVD